MTTVIATRKEAPGKGEPSDDQLLQEACGGEQLAFELLVHRYQRLLYHFAQRFLDGEQAQDVVQFVLLQLYLAMPRLRESNWKNTSLKAWLLCVARNRCVDELRRRKRSMSLFLPLMEDEELETVSPLDSLLDPDLLPEEQVEEKETYQQLSDAIEILPSTQRTIVRMRCEEELPFAVIAYRLNIPTATAKTYFHRACKKLRAFLASQYGMQRLTSVERRT